MNPALVDALAAICCVEVGNPWVEGLRPLGGGDRRLAEPCHGGNGRWQSMAFKLLSRGFFEIKGGHAWLPAGVGTRAMTMDLTQASYSENRRFSGFDRNDLVCSVACPIIGSERPAIRGDDESVTARRHDNECAEGCCDFEREKRRKHVWSPAANAQAERSA